MGSVLYSIQDCWMRLRRKTLFRPWKWKYYLHLQNEFVLKIQLTRDPPDSQTCTDMQSLKIKGDFKVRYELNCWRWRKNGKSFPEQTFRRLISHYLHPVLEWFLLNNRWFVESNLSEPFGFCPKILEGGGDVRMALCRSTTWWNFHYLIFVPLKKSTNIVWTSVQYWSFS